MNNKDKKDTAEIVASVISQYQDNRPQKSFDSSLIVDWVMRIGVLVITVVIVPMSLKLGEVSDKVTKIETREEYKNNATKKMEAFMEKDFYNSKDHIKNMIPYDQRITRNSENIEHNANSIIILSEKQIEKLRVLDNLQNKINSNLEKIKDLENK